MNWWNLESWILPAKPKVEPKEIEFVGGPFDGRKVNVIRPEPMLKMLVSAAVIDEEFSLEDGEIDATSIATYLLFSHDEQLAYHFTGGHEATPEPNRSRFPWE